MIFTPQKEALRRKPPPTRMRRAGTRERRGKVLHYLALIYPQAATLPLLQGELDLLGYPVPMPELDSHVGYLLVKGLISREEHSMPQKYGPSRRVRKVVLVKITGKGIDYYDGRLPADPGIYLEPK